MGYSYTQGSIRDFSIDGYGFRVAPSANFTVKINEYENEALPTSGRGAIKKTKIAQTVEGIELVTDAADRAVLASFADTNDLHTFSFKNAAGDVYRCTGGTLNIESYATETGITAITIQPVDAWTVSLAS